jgi:DNA-directed RNA polymerase specialized sigma24 family protein
VGRDPAGEREFRAFVAERCAGLQRTAYLMVGDWALAENLVLAALVKTYRAGPRAGDLDLYALRILMASTTAWRWRAERSNAPDRTDLIWERIQQLPRDQRGVLVLRYFDGLSEQRTADVLGIPVSAVRQRAAQALKSLSRRTTAGPLAIGALR